MRKAGATKNPRTPLIYSLIYSGGVEHLYWIHIRYMIAMAKATACCMLLIPRMARPCSVLSRLGRVHRAKLGNEVIEEDLVRDLRL